MGTLRFSGHESFQCRNLWLKKGFDFVTNPDESRTDFNHDLAVLDLGVGKNMVSSIRFWLKAFDMVDDENEQPTQLAEYLFSESGRDPFLEDLGTLWLLHYKLVKKSEASIYHLVFNRFRKQRIEFTKEHLFSYLVNECERLDENHSPNSIEKDVGVFLKSYVTPDQQKKKDKIEDRYSSLLIDLNLVKKFKNYGTQENEWYKIESSDREMLPIEIFFYVILDNFDTSSTNANRRKSISFHKLMNEDNSPGNIFALTPDALVTKINQLVQNFYGVVYKDNAGVRELQFNAEFDKEEILDKYYAKN
ncbi:DUF4007 family protein [Rhodohalobacter sp. SW132]|nr:DUF4007 family protein [Rhodohalobacter sp. SW132]REL24501.1 DUF4007 family protein [Rhodohalobacter sp. SW132]